LDQDLAQIIGNAITMDQGEATRGAILKLIQEGTSLIAGHFVEVAKDHVERSDGRFAIRNQWADAGAKLGGGSVDQVLIDFVYVEMGNSHRWTLSLKATPASLNH